MDFLFERLAWIAGQAPEQTAWRKAVLNLCHPEQRKGKTVQEMGEMLLEAARMLRAARQVAAEAYYYVVAWVVEYLGEEEIAQLYAEKFGPQFQAIQRAYGLRPYWEFREGQEPPEYIELSKEFERDMIRITADMFRRHREPVLAELYERDRDAFLRIKYEGRLLLLGPSQPEAEALS